MCKYVFLYCLLLWGINSKAQDADTLAIRNKKVLTSADYHKWPSLGTASISNNNRYVSYVVNNIPLGSSTGVIKSTDNNWKFEIKGAAFIQFSENSKLAIANISNDSLVIIRLNGSSVGSFSKILTFRLCKSGKKEFLILSRLNKELVICDLGTLGSLTYPNVSSFQISDNGATVFMLIDSAGKNKSVQVLNKVELSSRKILTIWNGIGFSGMQLNADASKLAILIKDTIEGGIGMSCIYKDLSFKDSTIIFDHRAGGMEKGSRIVGLQGFSDGSKILVNVKIKEELLSDTISDYVNVNIWSYRDRKLQSLQEKSEESRPEIYAYDIDKHFFTLLIKDGDFPLSPIKGDKILLLHFDPEADPNERMWNKTAIGRNFIVSTTNGERLLLNEIEPNAFCYFSPGCRFVIFYNSNDNNYYSYDTKNGEYINISKGVNTNWLRLTYRGRRGVVRGVAGWLSNDSRVLIYDRYDIWLLDPLGIREPQNITNGYGCRDSIIFTLPSIYELTSPIPDWAERRLIVSAMDIESKENGFFAVDIRKEEDPEKLAMGAYVYNIIGGGKALDKNEFIADRPRKYIVRRMSATESPNYYSTSDFKAFSSLSNIYPEKEYNWYTTELHTWKNLEGKSLKGILYKPENFDPARSYPVIFNYYEKKSDNLNTYLPPDYSSSDINIPTYVSNGYLVFTPDIDYKLGDPMEGTYSAVVSAAKYLSVFSFIDSTRMGIQGFSFGGIQTYFLVANSNLFSAACASSGISDMVSAYGTVSLSGASLQQSFHDGGQYRMDAAPWEKPDLYIKNSPIFKVNKVMTPLLIMHTTKDEACPFSQALEFYTALRRLGKKVWLLEYTDGMHSVQGKSAIDYDLRMRQYFDHYLMKKAAPVWMTRGIPAKLRHVDSGLKLDSLVGEP